jgi:hypothetical protein
MLTISFCPMGLFPDRRAYSDAVEAVVQGVHRVPAVSECPTARKDTPTGSYAVDVKALATEHAEPATERRELENGDGEVLTDEVVESRRTTIGILSICSMSLFIVGLDNTMVNVALPSISRQLHADVSGLQWREAGLRWQVTSVLKDSRCRTRQFVPRRWLGRQAGLGLCAFRWPKVSSRRRGTNISVSRRTPPRPRPNATCHRSDIAAGHFSH